MELPILQYLPLPDDARRIVLQFLRTPHPTAVLIKQLTFHRTPRVLHITGDTIRHGDNSNRRLLRKLPVLRFFLEENTGEYPDSYNEEAAASESQDDEEYSDYGDSSESWNSDS